MKSDMNKYNFLITVPLLLILLSSCAAGNKTRLKNSNNILHQDQNALEMAMVLSSGKKEITLKEALVSGSNIFIKYDFGKQTLYSSTDWTKRYGDSTKLPKTTDNTSVIVTPIENHYKEPWKNIPKDAEKVTTLTETDWHDFRLKVRERTTPKDGTHGVVVDFLHEVELFSYYDKKGKYIITTLENKPKHIKIKKSYRFDELVELAQPILLDFVESKNITGSKILFETGETGIYSYPFIYVDLEKQILVFLELHPGQNKFDFISLHPKRSRLLFHFAKSQITDVFTRPVTTAFRIFSLVTGSIADTFNITPIDANPSEILPLNTMSPMDLKELEKRLDEITGRKTSKGTIEYLVDGEEFYPAFIESMQGAKKSINIRTYIFDDDDYAVKIADILKEKSKEVKTKILMDGLGSIFATMEEPEYKTGNKDTPISMTLYLQSGSEVKVRQTTNPLFTGDHVKTTTIDHKTAFMGGMNIGREYRYEWHDLMVKLEGPIVDRIEHDFNKTWAHSGLLGDLGLLMYKMKPNKYRAEDKGVPLRLLYTSPGHYEIFRAKVEAIQRAKSYIYLENAYFSDDTLLHELIEARKRGVDVRVILTTKGDNGIMNINNALAANIMIAHGIRVYIYPGMSHVKAAIFDGWVCLGSANLDKLSLRINKELNIATSDETAAKGLMEKIFEPDFKKSIELTEPIPENWYDFLVEMLADIL